MGKSKKAAKDAIKGALIFNKVNPQGIAFYLENPVGEIVSTNNIQFHPDAMPKDFDPELHEGQYVFVFNKKK